MPPLSDSPAEAQALLRHSVSRAVAPAPLRSDLRTVAVAAEMEGGIHRISRSRGPPLEVSRALARPLQLTRTTLAQFAGRSPTM